VPVSRRLRIGSTYSEASTTVGWTSIPTDQELVLQPFKVILLGLNLHRKRNSAICLSWTVLNPKWTIASNVVLATVRMVGACCFLEAMDDLLPIFTPYFHTRLTAPRQKCKVLRLLSWRSRIADLLNFKNRWLFQSLDDISLVDTARLKNVLVRKSRIGCSPKAGRRRVETGQCWVCLRINYECMSSRATIRDSICSDGTVLFESASTCLTVGRQNCKLSLENGCIS